ncbi:hypothetical protein BST61_g11431 [Cercospora zeina]
MDPKKSGSLDAQDQAPEVSFQRDDGPIPASPYTTSVFDQSPLHHDKPPLSFAPFQQPFMAAYPQSMQTTVPSESKPEIDVADRTKRKWVWPLAMVVAALVALGVGIGIGYAVGDNNSSSDSPNSGNATNELVTSGNTGITAFSCDSSEVYASPFGSSFAQECYVSYKTNQTAYDNSSIIVKNFAGLTVYNFETCMDECVKRNRQLDIGNMLGERCTAVSFYANLTYSIPAWAGNCFIKNAKGIGRNWDENSNASLTARMLDCIRVPSKATFQTCERRVGTSLFVTPKRYRHIRHFLAIASTRSPGCSMPPSSAHFEGAEDKFFIGVFQCLLLTGKWSGQLKGMITSTRKLDAQSTATSGISVCCIVGLIRWIASSGESPTHQGIDPNRPKHFIQRLNGIEHEFPALAQYPIQS